MLRTRSRLRSISEMENQAEDLHHNLSAIGTHLRGYSSCLRDHSRQGLSQLQKLCSFRCIVKSRMVSTLAGILIRES